MSLPNVVELSDRRLVYRPWKVSSAWIFVVAGVALLAGGSIRAQVNGARLSSLTWLLIIGAGLAIYGLIYSYKNAELIIFDLTRGRVAKKSPLLPEKEIGRFSDIYAISTVSEMNTFQYVLTRKSQSGGGDIPISDSFYSNKMKADREAFETVILPVIEQMLNLKAP